MNGRVSQLDTTIDVVTPENIAFQYQVAGPFRRLPALLIDVAVRLAVIVSAVLLMGLMGAVGLVSGEIGLALLILLWFVLEWFYGGLLETFWNGQTVGKRAMGIRVLSTDGQPINGMQAVLRNILRLVDLMPLIPITAFTGEPGPALIPTGILGLFVPVLNNRWQRLGDLVCGTMVVIEQRTWLFRTAQLNDPQAARLAAELPGNFVVNGRLARALAAYIERRQVLSPARRQEIARHLGQHLVTRLQLPPHTSHDLLLCALYYRTFVADRAEQPAGRAANRTSSPAAAPSALAASGTARES